MTYPHRTKLRRAAACRGFTLIEVLLAALLVGVLLAAVWSLLGMYSRGLEGNSRRTDEAQLVRAWLQKLSDDLSLALAVDQERTAATVPRDTGRHPGQFIGDESSLSVDVGWESALGPAATRGLTSHMANAERGEVDDRARGLRRVTYALQEVRRFRGDTHSAAPTIVSRREIPWLAAEQQVDRQSQPRTALMPAVPGELYLNELHGISPGVLRLIDKELDSGLGAEVQSAPSAQVDSFDAGSRHGPSSADTDRPDESISLIPEIEHLRFRYYDGSEWTSSWDSRQRQSLPTVVEVTFRLRPPDRRRFDAAAAHSNGRRHGPDRIDSPAGGERDRRNDIEALPHDPPQDAERSYSRTPEPLPGELRALVAIPTGFPRRAADAVAGPPSRRRDRSLARSQP